jgi:hypothetical protein
MKKYADFLLCGMFIVLGGCQADSGIPDDIKKMFPKDIRIQVENPLRMAVTDEPVIIAIDSLTDADPGFNDQAWVAFSDGKEIPGQTADLDGNGTNDALVLIMPLAGNDIKTIHLLYAPEGKMERKYPQRVQAELAHKFGGKFVKGDKGKMVYEGGEFRNVKSLHVPLENTDHSFYIRYEGPGWESDKVGYRFYLDWRNATDIFGKKVTRPVLQNVGLDGYDSYHEMSDWGMDILKVGDALGIGGIGYWDGEKVLRVSQTDSVFCAITADGPEFAEVRTNYYGWKIGDNKYDLTSRLSILAGDRKTHHTVTISPDIESLCTGIVKHEGVKVLKQTDENSGWGYLATYGLQSLAGDSLGMAVLFRNADVIDLTEDNLNYTVVLKPSGGELDFYFLAAWEKEPGGIVSGSQFEQYLKEQVAWLNNPVMISL